MPTYSMMENHILAGKIAKEVREWGRQLFKPGAKLLDIAEAVEEKIREKGGQPAFPCCLSLNSIAAHYSPFPNDPLVLQKGDVIKLDMGAHINGKVADTACTIEIGTSNYQKLIEASEKAVMNAINLMEPGVKLGELGKTISETIVKSGFQPITNLSGHGLGDYIVHDHPTVPNHNNEDPTKLEEGQAIACEPFATTGQGSVKDGKPCGIYALVNKRPTRSMQARQVVEFIGKNYNTLPFSCRWIKVPGALMILNQLEREGILRQYTQLPEKSGGMVSQCEHSIIIGQGQIT